MDVREWFRKSGSTFALSPARSVRANDPLSTFVADPRGRCGIALHENGYVNPFTPGHVAFCIIKGLDPAQYDPRPHLGATHKDGAGLAWQDGAILNRLMTEGLRAEGGRYFCGMLRHELGCHAFHVGFHFDDPGVDNPDWEWYVYPPGTFHEDNWKGIKAAFDKGMVVDPYFVIPSDQ